MTALSPPDPAASALAPVAPRRGAPVPPAGASGLPDPPRGEAAPDRAAEQASPTETRRAQAPAGTASTPPAERSRQASTSPLPPRPAQPAAAGTPAWVPGSGRSTQPRAASGGPAGEPQAPAGGTRDSLRAPPAGTARTYTITLPAGLPLLSLNGREHWAARKRRSDALKKAAWAMAVQARIPPLGRVSVVVEYQPPDNRHRDADNPAPSAKACIDGIVAAGALEDDECPRYVAEIVFRIGEPHPGGRLVLVLTEVPELTDADPPGMNRGGAS